MVHTLRIVVYDSYRLYGSDYTVVQMVQTIRYISLNHPLMLELIFKIEEREKDRYQDLVVFSYRD